MARKVLNRKELREENDAAERDTKTKKKAVKGEEDAKKKPVKRKSRAKTAKEVRLKAFWGVFNQSMKRVALFDYSQRKQADKKAAEFPLRPRARTSCSRSKKSSKSSPSKRGRALSAGEIRPAESTGRLTSPLSQHPKSPGVPSIRTHRRRNH